MAPSTASSVPADEDQLLAQVFYLQGPGNTTIPVNAQTVGKVFSVAFATCINYSSQIGACFVMLLVMLTMTNRSRLSRVSSVINIAALVIGTIRCTLLSYYFTSSYMVFYRLFSGDFSTMHRSDTYASNAATFFSLPQLMLIEAALFLQAYSMVKLWPPLWKHVTLVVSVLIVVCAVAFKTAAVVLRIQRTLDLVYDPVAAVWVIQVDLAFSTATIFWFCSVFIARIVLHMWEYRSILPPMNTVSAMEVLVMTNGVLMIVPVIFAAMQLSGVGTFEAGSLCYTSVVIVLPLGVLIAQNLSHGHCGINSTGGSGGSGQSHPPGLGGSHLDSTGGHHGAYSRATTDSVNSKRRLFSSSSSHHRASEMIASQFPGGGISHVRIQGGAGGGGGGGGIGGKFGRHGGSRLGSMDTSTETDSFAKTKATVAVDPLERELDLIDTALPDNHVWVGHEVEVRKDLV